MWIQKSFHKESNKGRLILVPTPIGNLEDMTFRAINELKNADVIAAEDTRQTKKLCNYFEIETKLVSYHEHNKLESGQKLIMQMEEGKVVALVSDAGMPCISDPGEELVRLCIDKEIGVVPLPGANAALTSLVASGLPTDHFYFYGFLSRGKKEKKKELEQLKYRKDTIIFYESPHRLKETVKLMNDIFGNRRISVTRELTKKFEEFVRGTISEFVSYAEEVDARGEYCLIVEGSSEDEPESSLVENWWQNLSVVEHVNYYIDNKQFSSKESIKQVSLDRNVQKREIYQEYHQ
nr:16S rRNA (cytidine(1402)-2'-O)-methyltransferase [Lottiidibacillus patelloidae]